MVTRDADDEARRLFLPVKNNLAPLSKGLVFRLEQRMVGEPGKGVVASSVELDHSHVEITSDQASVPAQARSVPAQKEWSFCGNFWPLVRYR